MQRGRHHLGPGRPRQEDEEGDGRGVYDDEALGDEAAMTAPDAGAEASGNAARETAAAAGEDAIFAE